MAKMQIDGKSPDIAEVLAQANAETLGAKADPITPETLATLDNMDANALRSLIRRVSGAIWNYALQDDNERAEAARLKLYSLGMSAIEVHKAVPALDKWFDRTVGKPAQTQTVEMNVKGEVTTTLRLPATERFLASIMAPVIEN